MTVSIDRPRFSRRVWLLITSIGLLLAAHAGSLSAQQEVGSSRESVALEAEVAQAYDLFESGDDEKALASFNRILDQDSESLAARLGRAMIFADQRRHAEAFSAYDAIVRRHPDNAFAWNGRGLAAFNLENFDEALSSFERATVGQPVNGFFYESLAWTHLCLGEFSDARKSAKLATLMYSQKGESSAYPLLIAYFSSIAAGDSKGAQRTLGYALNNKPADNAWPHPVFDYLAGRIAEPGLISHIDSFAEETEAHTYIGLNLRARGHSAAGRHLSWVAEKGDERVFEYTLARALQNDPKLAVLGP